jgi:hypothetical protein
MDTEEKKYNYTLVTAVFVIALGAAITYYYSQQNDSYWMIGVFFLDVIFVIVGALLAFVLSFFNQSKSIAKGILIGIGIVSLIGLSVCSMS